MLWYADVPAKAKLKWFGNAIWIFIAGSGAWWSHAGAGWWFAAQCEKCVAVLTRRLDDEKLENDDRNMINGWWWRGLHWTTFKL